MQIAVFAVMGVVALVVGLILLLVLPALGLWSLVIVGLGIILVASAAIIDRGRSVSRTLTSKRGKFGTSTTILVSVFSAIILLVNAIGVWKFQRFDFTGLSQFTLTQQTKDVLAKLDVPVEVTCFFAPSVPGIETELQDMYKSVRIYSLVLLAEYRNYTDKLIISIKDPEQEPELARKYGITNQYLYQTVVFETKQGMRRVPPWETFAEAENAFTSAILEVTGIKQKKIYFLTGHGEASPLDTSPIGYDSARQTLRDNLYRVEPLDLVATPKIPDDAAVLVIAGPRTAMNDNERQIIADYLKNSGQVFFLTNPGAPDDIARLLAPWGVDVKTGTVIDPTNYSAPNRDSPIVNRDGNYFGLTTVYFPGVTAIAPQDKPVKGIELIPVLLTSANSWLTTTDVPASEAKFDETKDTKGPLYIGFIILPASSEDATQTATSGPRIAVIGDSDFASNKHFVNGDNSDLFLNIVSGFAAGSELITIQRKVLQTRRLILSPEKERFLTYSSIAFLPLVILAIGVFVWWRRR